ncbi:MAG: PH domain-containing protein [Candidatus Thermoplasmatota archaeon]
MTDGWLPASEPGFALRPSLLAAASIFAKLVSFIAFLLALPLIVAVLAGNGAAILGSVIAAQFGLFAVLPAIAGLLLPGIRLLATRYELDDEGVRIHSSIIARSDQRVPWDKVTLLVQQRSLVDRALGIETLTVIAYGARGATLNLVGLRDAAPLRDYAARKMRESASVAGLFAND